MAHVLDPHALCPTCGLEAGVDRELVVIEAGELRVSRKKQRMDFCVSREPDRRSRLHMHLDCLLALFDFTTDWGPEDEGHCLLCHHPLRRWVFRFQIGRIHSESLEFLRLRDDKNFALSCPQCIINLFEDEHEQRPQRPAPERAGEDLFVRP